MKDSKDALEPTTSNLILSIKRAQQFEVMSILNKAAKYADVNYKDFPTLLEVLKKGDLEGLLKRLHASGVIDLANNLSVNVASINNVVNVNALLYAGIKATQKIDWNSEEYMDAEPGEEQSIHNDFTTEYLEGNF